MIHDTGALSLDLTPASFIITVYQEPLIIDVGLASAPDLQEASTRLTASACGNATVATSATATPDKAGWQARGWRKPS